LFVLFNIVRYSIVHPTTKVYTKANCNIQVRVCFRPLSATLDQIRNIVTNGTIQICFYFCVRCFLSFLGNKNNISRFIVFYHHISPNHSF